MVIRSDIHMNVASICTATLRGLAATGLLWSAAAADDGPGDGRLRLAQANPCAIYGSGYVTVHGGSECAQIRGRLRVEQNESQTPLPYAPEPGYAPAGVSPGDEAGRAHLRLPAAATRPDAPRTR